MQNPDPGKSQKRSLEWLTEMQLHIRWPICGSLWNHSGRQSGMRPSEVGEGLAGKLGGGSLQGWETEPREEVSSVGATDWEATTDGTLCVPTLGGKPDGHFQSFLYMLIITTNPQMQGKMLGAYTYLCCESFVSCLSFLLSLLHPSLSFIHFFL